MTTDASSQSTQSKSAAPVRIFGEAGTLTLPRSLPASDDGSAGSVISFGTAQASASEGHHRVALVPATPGAFTITF